MATYIVRASNVWNRAQDLSLYPVMDRIAFGVLWAFVLTLPLEGNTLIGGLVMTRWLSFLVLAAAILRYSVRSSTRKLCALHGWMAAFVIWVALSLIWTLDPETTLTRIGSYLQLSFMAWIVWELALTEERCVALLYAYCTGALVSSLNEIRNLIMGVTGSAVNADKLAWYGRYAPQGFDQNEFALLLALSIPMTLYLLTRRQSPAASILCWAQLGLGPFAILLTGSRAGLIALGVALLLLPFVWPSLRGWKKKICWVALPCIAVAAVAFVPDVTWERLLTTGSEISGGTLDHRTVIWAAGLHVFQQHPLIGVGSGAFAASVVGAIDIDYVAHNSFLSVLVELGVVGALILLGLLASLFYVAFRMGGVRRWLWTVLLLTWAAGVSSLTWEHRKATWFVFAMVAADAGVRRTRTRAIVTAMPARPLAASGPDPFADCPISLAQGQGLRRFV